MEGVPMGVAVSYMNFQSSFLWNAISEEPVGDVPGTHPSQSNREHRRRLSGGPVQLGEFSGFFCKDLHEKIITYKGRL